MWAMPSAPPPERARPTAGRAEWVAEGATSAGESAGGLVHSYGLAAAQLDRLQAADLTTTVCIDKVAASGGYMMACTANHIKAAPFAVIGSIGVVAQVPNIHRLLKRNDIDVELLTAGKYKRTLTVLGENTEEGREKFIDDLENNAYPMPIVSTDTDITYVGRIRKDVYAPNIVHYFNVADQVRVGAATNSVRIALKWIEMENDI